MLITIIILLGLIFIAQIYSIFMNNNAFIETNVHLDQTMNKVEHLVKECDKIIAKYKTMVKEIEAIK